jgi:uncharacterized protein (DUF1330 family)
MWTAARTPVNGEEGAMAFELTVGLLIADQETYAQYRAEMRPLLEAIGGRFRYDFDVARALKSEASHDINRVFVLQFPDRASKERFFSDPRYMEIRGRLFEKAVAATSWIAEYER